MAQSEWHFSPQDTMKWLSRLCTTRYNMLYSWPWRLRCNTAVWTVLKNLLLSQPGSIPSTYKTVRCHKPEKKIQNTIFPISRKIYPCTIISDVLSLGSFLLNKQTKHQILWSCVLNCIANYFLQQESKIWTWTMDQKIETLYEVHSYNSVLC